MARRCLESSRTSRISSRGARVRKCDGAHSSRPERFNHFADINDEAPRQHVLGIAAVIRTRAVDPQRLRVERADDDGSTEVHLDNSQPPFPPGAVHKLAISEQL